MTKMTVREKRRLVCGLVCLGLVAVFLYTFYTFLKEYGTLKGERRPVVNKGDAHEVIEQELVNLGYAGDDAKSSSSLKQRIPLGNIEHVEAPLITCAPDDVTDTRFIQEIHGNETVRIPPKSVLEKLSREELATLYHRYVENVQYLCRRKVRLGNIDDGGWDVCDEARHRPAPPCLIYSFGINNDFTFDDAVIQMYGCEVHSFDPSMGVGDFTRGTMNHFHAVGVSARDQHKEGWRLLSYDSIKSNLGHKQRPVTILKMDIEKWEWEVLSAMIRQGALHEVDQLLVELHLEVSSPEQNRDKYLMAVKLLKDLYDVGFRIFWTNQNKWCKFTSRCKRLIRTNCHEVNFIKVR